MFYYPLTAELSYLTMLFFLTTQDVPIYVSMTNAGVNDVKHSGNEDTSLLRYDAVSTGNVTDVSVGRAASILRVCTLD
jgi:hypothetical protein